MEPHGYSQTMWFKCISSLLQPRPSPTVCLSTSSHAHEEASCQSNHPSQMRTRSNPCCCGISASWVFMRKVAKSATCQLCGHPWRDSLRQGGTMLHEDWLQNQLQKAKAKAAAKKPAAKGQSK